MRYAGRTRDKDTRAQVPQHIKRLVPCALVPLDEGEGGHWKTQSFSVYKLYFFPLIFILVFCFFFPGETSVLPPARPPFQVRAGVYVWQKRWEAPVYGAIQEARREFSHFFLLAGQFTYRRPGPSWTFKAISIPWSKLPKKDTHWTLVFRLNAEHAILLSQRKNLSEPLSRFRQAFSTLLHQAKAKEVSIAGIQLDYDCPTSKLSDYRHLLEGLRRLLPEVTWSITALPTWMSHPDFPSLIRYSSYYVLQVHSFEPPHAPTDPPSLFNPLPSFQYIRQAAAFGRPFYVALPTYGYEVVFDAHGRFKALRAEGPARVYNKGDQRRLVLSHPQDVLALLQKLHSVSLPSCRGVIWFRLPVSGDEFNWSWAAFKAVLQGHLPRRAFQVVPQATEKGLCELWVANTGEEETVGGHIGFQVSWNAWYILGWDTLNHFVADAAPAPLHGIWLHGPPPRIHQGEKAAWFRLSPMAFSSPTLNPCSLLHIQDIHIHEQD